MLILSRELGFAITKKFKKSYNLTILKSLKTFQILLNI
jgi:hypothetical protein